MSTAELKTTLHTLIEKTNDSSILNAIYAILSKVIGGKNTAAAISLSADEKKAADEALKSVKKGHVYSHEKVMLDMKKKYPSLIK